ncbi:hypothetical protein A5798_000021, partial [Enterococcus sp. 6C8_DIV0013]
KQMMRVVGSIKESINRFLLMLHK